MTEINLLADFLNDARVADVLVCGYDLVLLERGGVLEQVASPFSSENELTLWARALLKNNGSRLDIAKPISEVSFTCEFGLLRVHSVLAGECSKKTQVSVRRHSTSTLTLQDLETGTSISKDQSVALSEIIQRRENFVVLGGTGSGKTTLLKAMLNEVSVERIITIEDAPELNLLGNSVELTTRINNHEGIGEISLARLLREALRMRPDRLVIGEARGDELLLLLQAMNTGHSGSGFTLHANSVEDAVPRMLAILAGVGVDPKLASLLIASSITWLIEVKRMGPLRRVTAITRLLKANV